MRERERFLLTVMMLISINSSCLLNQTVTIFEKQIQNHWFIHVDCFTCLQSHTFCNSNKLSCGCLKVTKSHFPVTPDNMTA